MLLGTTTQLSTHNQQQEGDIGTNTIHSIYTHTETQRSETSTDKKNIYI